MKCSPFSKQLYLVYKRKTVVIAYISHRTCKINFMKFNLFRTGLTVSVLKLLSSLLTTSGKSETDHFAILFDEMEAKSNQSKHEIVSNDGVVGYQKLIGKRKTEINQASELIFSFLVDLFHCSKSKLH